MDAKTKPASGEFPHVSPERAKFVALAQARMNRAIKAIRAVGQLERWRGHIELEDVMMMERRLGEELNLARDRLRAAAQGEPNFTLQRPIIAWGDKLVVPQHDDGEG